MSDKELKGSVKIDTKQSESAITRLGNAIRKATGQLKTFASQTRKDVTGKMSSGIDKLTTKLNNFSSKAGTGAVGKMKGLGEAALNVGKQFAFILGPIAAAGAALVAFAVGATQARTEMDKLAAGTDNYLKANKILTESGGIAKSTDFIDGLRDASKDTITQIDALRMSNQALLLDVAKSPKQFSELSQAAIVLGQSVQQGPTESIDSLIIALGRASPEILDNLGIQLKASEAQEIYAKSIGKTVAQLTVEERKLAFVEVATDRVIKKAEQLGGANSIVVSSTDKVSVAWNDLKLAFGDLVDSPVNGFIDGLAQRLENVSDLTVTWKNNLEQIPTVLVAATGADIGGFSDDQLSEKARIMIIKQDIDAINEFIETQGEYNNAVESMVAARSELEAELAGLEGTEAIDITGTINNNIQAMIDQQNAEKAAAAESKANARERNNQLKKFQALQKAGFITQEKLITLTMDKEMTLAKRQEILEADLESARVQTHVRRLERIDEVARKEADIGQLQSSIDKKRSEAVASFNKRKNEFYANEEKRLKDLREQGLKSQISGLVGDLKSELGGLFGDEGDTDISREIAENARRLAAVAAGDIGGESAQLLKESGIWDKVFGGETDPALIQARAQEIGSQLVKGFDTLGIVDVEAAADRIINMVLGPGGPSLEDAIYAEVVSRDLLSPEQLDKAFGITKEEFGETLDVSIIGDDEIEQIQKLQSEIESMSIDGAKDLDALAEATAGTHEAFVQMIEDSDEEIARLIEILRLSGLIKDTGMFGAGIGGHGGSGASTAPGAPAPSGGGQEGTTPSTPSTPNTSFQAPSSFTPNTSNFTPANPSTTFASGGKDKAAPTSTTQVNHFKVVADFGNNITEVVEDVMAEKL
jgi:hypothetical protein